MRQLLLFALVLCATSRTSVAAPAEPSPDAEAVSPQAEPAAPENRSRILDPEDGQLDLSSYLAKPSGFLPIPIVVTEPAIGYGGGAAAMFLRPREEAGAEGFARPNISGVGAFATENATWGGFAGDASRWMEGRLRTQVGGGLGRINLDFYGLGPDATSLDEKVRYSLEFTGALVQANWQPAPKSPWAIGLRYVYADVEPKLRDDEPAYAGLADRVPVKISAPTAVVEYDTRDNVFTPTRGLYAESSWLVSRETLGATDDFERFDQIVMGWHQFSDAVTFGARGNYAWASSDAPFFMLPYVVLRGVPAVRYQGQRTASAEAELRWQFYGRWSVVGFGGYGATRTGGDAFSANQSVGAGGVGFRYELARKFGLHAGIDVAYSPGTTAFYFQIGNAWFRP